MRNISKIYRIVQKVLEENPSTRNSDAELYIEVCKIINPNALERPFKEVFLNRNKYGLPNTETVRRSRQKAQETHEELKANERIVDERYNNFKTVRKWALSE